MTAGIDRRGGNSIGQKNSGIDWMLILLAAVLTVLGLIMQYSASSYDLSLVEKQGIIAIVGFALALIISRLPVVFLRKTSIILFLLTLGLTIFTKFKGKDVKGAKRWIEIGGFTLQPSELLKVTMILAMATIIVYYINEINDFQNIKWKDFIGKEKSMTFPELLRAAKGYLLMLFLIVLAALVVAIATQDLGTAVIIFVVGIVMILIVSPRLKGLIAIIGGALLMAGILILAFPYRRGRIAAWFNLGDYTSDLRYQVNQGLYAIGSGGWFGKGLGKSLQKTVIPEPHTDMIFSIICEELGIIGGIIIIVLFILMILRMKSIYDGIQDLFGKMIVAGVAAHIAVQVFINTAVITSLLPNTGVPLPFISYGGTSLISLLIELGLVMCVSRKRQDRKRPAGAVS